jgi:hypothetical protein
MDKQTKKQIQAWLDGGRDYNEGFLIFCKASRNRNLIRFIGNTTERARKMLPQELAKLIGAAHGDRPATLDGQPEPAKTQRVITGGKAAPVANTPTIDQDTTRKGLVTPQDGDAPIMLWMKKRLEVAFRQRTNLHGQLEACETDEQRKELATSIHDLTVEIDYVISELELGKIKRGFSPEAVETFQLEQKAKQANVTIPASIPAGFDFTDGSKLQKRIATVSTYISRAKDAAVKEKWETEKLFLEKVRDGIITL